MTDHEILTAFSVTKSENESGYMLAVAREIIGRERERCAKLCDIAAGNHRDHSDRFRRGAGHCAAAIRGS